jgi:hypothetical protein
MNPKGARFREGILRLSSLHRLDSSVTKLECTPKNPKEISYLDGRSFLANSRKVDKSRLTSWTRVYLLAMRVELRLQRPLILFTVRAMS